MTSTDRPLHTHAGLPSPTSMGQWILDSQFSKSPGFSLLSNCLGCFWSLAHTPIPGFAKSFRSGPLNYPTLSAWVGQLAPSCWASCLTLLSQLPLGGTLTWAALIPLQQNFANKTHFHGSLVSDLNWSTFAWHFTVCRLFSQLNLLSVI